MGDYTTKSMNGIITISDGMGTDISNGTIETLNLDLNNLICNNLQGQTPTDDVFLYTNTTGNINLGGINSTVKIDKEEVNELDLNNLICNNMQGRTTTDNIFLYTTTTEDINIGGLDSTTIVSTIKSTDIKSKTGTLNIGTATDSLTFPATSNKFSKIDSLTNSSPLNICFNHIVNAFLSLGSFVSTIRIGVFDFIANSITSQANTDIINLFNNLTTGDINMGTSMSGLGVIKIGSNTSETEMGNLIYNNKIIRTKNTNDTVSLFESGVNTGLPFDGTINMGNIGTTLNLGRLVVQPGGTGIYEIRGPLGTAFNFLTNLTTDTLNIATNMTNVGSPRGTVNIGSAVALVTACTTTFSSNVGSGLCLIHPSTASKPMTIGTNDNDALITNNLTLRSSSNINLSTTGLITIGSTGAITMGATQTASNYINIGSTTTVGATGLRVFQPITCINGSNWVTPATNQVGGIISSTLVGSSSGLVPLTIQLLTLTAGSYAINANVNYSSQTTWNVTSISFTNNAQNYGCAQYGGHPTVNFGVNLSLFWIVPTSTTQYLYLIAQSSSVTAVGAVSFKALKIA